VTDGQRARGGPDEIDVFATGATHAVATDSTVLPDLLRRSGSTVRVSYAHARDFHARAGHRPGTPLATVSPRRTGTADIVRPVLVNPIDACDVAVSGRLFDDRVPGLDIERHLADADGARYLVWNAWLHVGSNRLVPASLHLLGSPSMVVTVLELVPQRRLRRQRTAFVRHGLAALDALASRLGRITPACGDVGYGVASTTPDAQIA